MNGRKITYLLLLVFTLGFLLRLLPIVFESQAADGDQLRGDQAYFHIEAGKILEQPGYLGKGGSLSYRAPGYTLFLAGLYAVLGRNLMVIRLLQALMGVLVCFLTYLLGRRLFSQAVGVIAALILATNLGFVYLPATLLSENLFMLIFAVTMLYFIKFWEEPSLKNKVMLGFSLGLAALTRAIAQFLPLFIFLGMWVRARQLRGKTVFALKHWVVVLLFFILPIIPWTIRNYHVHRTFVPIAMEGGFTLYISFAIDDMRGFGFGTNDAVEAEARKMATEAQRSRFYYQQAFKHIKQNLLKLPKLTLFKALYFFSPLEWELTGGEAKYNAIYVFSLPFFILGLYTLLREKTMERLPLLITIIYFTLVGLTFQLAPRFRLPIEPCISIIAAAGIWQIFHNFKGKIMIGIVILCWLLFNVLIFLNVDYYKGLLKQILQTAGWW